MRVANGDILPCTRPRIVRSFERFLAGCFLVSARLVCGAVLSADITGEKIYCVSTINS